MAKCDLSIELDDPKRIYAGGQTIAGTIHVDADADVRCRALDVTCGWRTHGRGNVTRGEASTVTVFEGNWVAGQRESYRFELTIADWPPSYHGDYINVDHYIDARAKIPWAFDPKASQEFVMRPTVGPDVSDQASAGDASGCIAKFVITFVVLALLTVLGGMVAALVTNPFAGLVVCAVVCPLIGLFVAIKWLPKYLLGEVIADLQTPVVAPGGHVKATLSFEPKRDVRVNGIWAEINGTEVCVSGSGSNRTTHRKCFYSKRHDLSHSARIRAGQRQSFQLDWQLPDDVPYSFDLSDNDLNWTVDLRVDIPRWPDWKKTLKINVFPDPEAETKSESQSEPSSSGVSPDPELAGQAASPEITFAETASHLWQARRNVDQVDLLVDAVTGMRFDIGVFVERRLLYSGEEDPEVYDDGYAVWARHDDPPLPLVLYIPGDLADEFEQAGRDLWTIPGEILGWDHQHDRLQIKVLQPGA